MKILLLSFLIAFMLDASLLFAQAQQTPSYMQKQNYEWPFSGSGFNFNNDTLIQLPPTLITYSSGWHSSPGAICDTTGKLLFYTDGYGIYYGTPPPGNNPNNFCMPNAFPIVASTYPVLGVGGFPDPTLHAPTVDGSVIVSMIDSPGKYYVFTNEQDVYLSGNSWFLEPYGYCTLYYSVVDMHLNNGYGDIEPGRKAIAIDSGLTDAVEAIVGDDCNVWLVVHDLYNTYKAYNITSTGIDSIPVVSIGANTIGVNVGGLFYSQVTCSPNRKKIAAEGELAMEVSDFDPATGIVSNSIFQVISGAIGDWYNAGAVAFSPDNTKLYTIQSSYFTDNDSDEIIQYDLSAGPGPWAPIDIYNTVAGGIDQFCERLGPDGKIYFSNLYVIDSPNLSGTACHVSSLPANLSNAIAPQELYATWFYPTNPSPVLPNRDTVVTTQQLVTCFEDTAIIMTASDTTGWNYTWADYNKFRLHVNHRKVDTNGVFMLTYNTSGCQYHIDSFIVKYIAPYTVNLGADTIVCNNSSFSYLLSPHATVAGATYLWQDGSSDSTYTATGQGIYWVTVTDTGCKVSDTMQVKDISFNVNLGNDTTLCADKPIQFRLQVDSIAAASYLWSTGSTANAINIADAGMYWVTVSDKPCMASDTINIQKAYCQCAFGMPNAFTPNGDNKNDIFRPVLPQACPVSGYRLSIYNRWGQLVFTSTNVSQGWDGTFNGVAADIGTYEYTLQFEAGTYHEQHQQKGDLTLIR